MTFSELPTIEVALGLVRDGIATGASARNWASYGESVRMDADTQEWQRKLITDPQTSGGLLIACTAETADDVLVAIRTEQGTEGRVVGRMEAGEPVLRVV